MINNYFEYLDYYGDSSFTKIKLNEVDMFLFSVLVYLPVEKHKEGITIEDYGKLLSKYNPDEVKGIMTPEALRLLPIVSKLKRYKNIRIYKMEKTCNEKLQFGAFTLRFGNITCVIYEGTNTSMAGWMENFRLSAKFPTLTQEYGIRYLTKTINDNDKKIYIAGHSKGGNLTLSSTYLAPDNIFDRIKKIYNFDGPGYRLSEFNTERFKVVNRKTTNYLPDGSLIGIFLRNKNYRFVETTSVAFSKHDPINWLIYGDFFRKAELSSSSQTIRDKFMDRASKISDEDMLKTISVCDKFLKDNNIIHTYDLSKINVQDMITMINDIKDLDENSKKLLIEFLKYIFEINKNK